MCDRRSPSVSSRMIVGPQCACSDQRHRRRAASVGICFCVGDEHIVHELSHWRTPARSPVAPSRRRSVGPATRIRTRAEGERKNHSLVVRCFSRWSLSPTRSVDLREWFTFDVAIFRVRSTKISSYGAACDAPHCGWSDGTVARLIHIRYVGRRSGQTIATHVWLSAARASQGWIINVVIHRNIRTWNERNFTRRRAGLGSRVV